MPASDQRRTHTLAAIVFACAALGLGGFEWLREPPGKTLSVYPPSEVLMQTVSATDLAAQPFASLWYLHIQPPVLDALRATIVHVACRDCPTYRALTRCVDAWLLRVWLLVYATSAALVFLWLTRITGRRWLGALGAAVLCLHPASIYFASYLDSTCLSALLTTWFYFELWRARDRTSGSVLRLSVSTCLLFLTRSAFQWPFVLVMCLALWLRGFALRRIAGYGALAGGVVAAYALKQYLLFGLALTSSFASLNGCRALGLACASWPDGVMPQGRQTTGVRVLDRVYKPNGSPNYNNLDYLRVAQLQRLQARDALARQPLSQTAAALIENVTIYLRPSSGYKRKNPLADGLPWRASFDGLFSGLPLLALLVAALGFWVWRSRGSRLSLLGLSLPAVYLIFVCTAAERGENMRFKYFLEPAAIVLLLSTTDSIGRAVRGKDLPNDHQAAPATQA
jgi:hypothetical protein